MRHDFLELQEEEAARAKAKNQPREEGGFMRLAGGVGKAMAVAAAARSMAPKTDSPIEARLGGRLQLMVEGWNKEHKPYLVLVPQFPLYRFRYDFAILANGKLVLAIECDGKEFHSSEAAQLNDKTKNAAIWNIGAEIFRFTGSEIYRQDAECVAKVETYLRAFYPPREPAPPMSEGAE